MNPGLSRLTTTSQAPRKEVLEKLGLTFEVRKASKLLAKFMTNENMTSNTIHLLSWLLPRPGSPVLYPQQSFVDYYKIK